VEDDVDVWRYTILELHARNDNDDNHQTAAKHSNFWHSNLRDSCESAYVFHLTCVMPVPGKTFQNGVVEYNWSQVALNNCNSRR